MELLFLSKQITSLNELSTYLQLGFEHISDLNAYDHIVFIIALTAIYRIKDIKIIFWLVSAFTVGHSLSLALATLQVIVIPSAIIEFLIPVTILSTAIYNVLLEGRKERAFNGSNRINYGIAILFGLIHGLGFSNYLQMLLGSEANILLPLLSFNIGLELGQLLIVALILGAMFIAERILKMKQNEWVLFLSGVAAGISLILMQQTKFW